MRLIIVSGLSGSGKSVALHMLEDIDFYCVDNIPAALLKPFISHTIRGTDEVYPRTAVGLDARNRPNEIETIPALVAELRRSGINCEVLYLHASDEVLLKRYAETRRKHPLISASLSLREAIDSERRLLEPITTTCWRSNWASTKTPRWWNRAPTASGCLQPLPKQALSGRSSKQLAVGVGASAPGGEVQQRRGRVVAIDDGVKPDTGNSRLSVGDPLLRLEAVGRGQQAPIGRADEDVLASSKEPLPETELPTTATLTVPPVCV